MKTAAPIEPTLGRIVLYRQPPPKLAEPPPAKTATATPPEAPELSPAIVTAVNKDGSVDLFVFRARTPYGSAHANVHAGDGDEQWSWPPRAVQEPAPAPPAPKRGF